MFLMFVEECCTVMLVLNVLGECFNVTIVFNLKKIMFQWVTYFLNLLKKVSMH